MSPAVRLVETTVAPASALQHLCCPQHEGTAANGVGTFRAGLRVGAVVRRFLVLVTLILAGCGANTLPNTAGEVAVAPTATVGQTRETPTPLPDPVVVPLSLYVVHEEDAGEDSTRSSSRNKAELDSTALRIAEIWEAAGIVFDPLTVATIDVPADVLADLVAGDANPFLAGAGRLFDVPEPGAINGFYVSVAGGANGFTPQNSRVFFVTDEPSVHDERVSSHEIGHILGLRHALDDPGRLMFSGTNGMSLTDTEITVARYGAAGIMDGAR